MKGFNYAAEGAYFVTICIQNRDCIFGSVADKSMVLNEMGEIAQACWVQIPDHFPSTWMDSFVIMPNHLHGIIWIGPVGARHAVPLPINEISVPTFGQPVRGSLGTIIRSYKSAVTRALNLRRQLPGATIWQRNYYERIVRSEAALDLTRRYISDNPANWSHDPENPERASRLRRGSPEAARLRQAILKRAFEGKLIRGQNE
jgi:putative transposase